MSKKVALVGNPNTGKSSIFNILTGLYQKVGNYPGVTVDKKNGKCKLPNGEVADILDLPGIYSLSNPVSLDEQIAADTLTDNQNKDFPDLVVFVADAKHLKRNLFLFTQLIDLSIPTVLVINMWDTVKDKGIIIDLPRLEQVLQVEIIPISARKGTGIEALRKTIEEGATKAPEGYIDMRRLGALGASSTESSGSEPSTKSYKHWLEGLRQCEDARQVKEQQHREAVLRYQYINQALKGAYHLDALKAEGWRGRLDRALMHPVWGYVIFALILGLIFQAIYSWSAYPMDWIDHLFSALSEKTKQALPHGKLTDLISDGILPGIGGIVIFIPQIALLFCFVELLEESGYMGRVVFLMDRWMSKFGLSGKSVVPLVSGAACAIPAIMASRNIENTKERLLTILAVPFMVCSARLPVYLIIISTVIPNESFYGIQVRGMALFFLYLLGFVCSIAAAFVWSKVVKSSYKNTFVTEIPDYRIPILKNVAFVIYQKVKSFVFDAGKIILAISIVIWFFSSHGNYELSDEAIEAEIIKQNPGELASSEAVSDGIASYKLEHSYIAKASKYIEPAIEPLGYDWKIGVALLSSFAAREVFVSAISTIFGGGTESIQAKIANEENRQTGKKLFNLASGASLLIFYALAMQCMSTLAIVKRETNGWKWPLLQFFTMNGLAYLAAMMVYKLLIPFV